MVIPHADQLVTLCFWWRHMTQISAFVRLAQLAREPLAGCPAGPVWKRDTVGC